MDVSNPFEIAGGRRMEQNTTRLAAAVEVVRQRIQEIRDHDGLALTARRAG